VDLDLTSNQELLVDTSARFMDATYPLTAVREHAPEADAGPDYRRQAAELGWFAMLVPEEFGGGSVSGNGVLDAALIAQARGARLQPGAFVGTNVVAHALSADGVEDHQRKVLAALVNGEEAAACALIGPGGGTGVVARRQAGDYVLSGTKVLVQDAHRSAWVLVTADTDEGAAQFLLPADTPGMAVRALDGLDLTRRFAEVDFADARVPSSTLVGDPARAAGEIERRLQVACALTVAESVGAMDYDLALAVQYAKDRIAFGRPIGSFQAVKHLLADTSLMLEMSKALALAAARAVGENQIDAGEVASMAKAFVGDCGIELAQNCFQVFGGIGYTWEHDQHLYLRRLTTDAALYGDPTWHRERLCQLAGL
jgi:alkylation response protein AidB-like acyl-CoA dehydrogenase